VVDDDVVLKLKDLAVHGGSGDQVKLSAALEGAVECVEDASEE